MVYLFLHGLGQTPESWTPVLREFRENAVCPSLFGLLQGQEANYPNLYQAVSKYCERLEAPFALCGLSLGGVLALHYAIEHPERVQALALVGTPFKMPKRLLGFQNAVFSLLPEGCFREMGLGKREVIALSRSMAALDFRKDLGRISCPVLSACGARDRANRRAAQELAQAVPRAELAWVEGAGHAVNEDAPEALSALLRSFFPN